jgi:5-methylcytosine-specific restriction endonuclease McrA
LAKTHRHRASKRALLAEWTEQDWKECLEYFGHCCVYCGRSDIELQQEHLIPIDGSRLPDDLQGTGGTFPANMVPACQTCNASKGNKDPFEHVKDGPFWVRMLGRVTKPPALVWRDHYPTETAISLPLMKR